MNGETPCERQTTVASIDTAHAAMFSAMWQLSIADDAALSETFPAFVAAVEQDFRDEESVMEGIAFPGLHGHREAHARVLGALHHAQARVANGDPRAGRDALQLLPQWFTLHLETMDKALSKALMLAENTAASSLACAAPGVGQLDIV